MIKDHHRIYIILVFSLLIQLYFQNRFSWFPDISLVVVVFSGMFFAAFHGIFLGLLTGLLRGFFSAGDMGINVFIFPLIGYMSFLLSTMFYRKNPFFHSACTLAGFLFYLVVQIMYYNLNFGSAISLMDILSRSWLNVSLTVISAPLCFKVLDSVMRLEE